MPDDDGAGNGPGQRRLRIPGIGKVVALSVRLEVDDISRFERERAFFSYCRVVPGASNSGDRVRHKRSRDGNPTTGRRRPETRFLARGRAGDPVLPGGPDAHHLRWVGCGTKKRRKPDVVARALVAKEIDRIVYHVLRKHQDFNGQFGARLRAQGDL